MDIQEAIDRARACVTDAVGDLLNRGHLYQSVTVDAEAVKSAFSGLHLGARDVETVSGGHLIKIVSESWRFQGGRFWRGANIHDERLPIRVPTVRTYCDRCSEVLPFNPTEMDGSALGLEPDSSQVFSIPLECQGCKGFVVVFMVTRLGLKLTLSGRSVIEKVQSPPFIPKAHRRWYSGAIIAHRTGQSLAALFLLRTLIEQHMRVASGSEKSRGAELAEAYNRKLPSELKSWAPSLGTEYDRLSEALHAAREDNELFEQSLEMVEKHFDAKATFERVNRSKSVPG